MMYTHCIVHYFMYHNHLVVNWLLVISTCTTQLVSALLWLKTDIRALCEEASALMPTHFAENTLTKAHKKNYTSLSMTSQLVQNLMLLLKLSRSGSGPHHCSQMGRWTALSLIASPHCQRGCNEPRRNLYLNVKQENRSYKAVTIMHVKGTPCTVIITSSIMRCSADRVQEGE